MKNTYTLKMEIEQEGNNTVVKIRGKCPQCMSNTELSGFIECLKTVNEMCIDVVNERIRDGKIKSKKK